jgi:hypothetical protein
MQSEAEVKANIVMKAAEDDDFRARLVADPRAALEAETGLRFPDDYRLHVHEESATDAHLVLPPKPELSKQQLDHIAGGDHMAKQSWPW